MLLGQSLSCHCCLPQPILLTVAQFSSHLTKPARHPGVEAGKWPGAQGDTRQGTAHLFHRHPHPNMSLAPDLLCR